MKPFPALALIEYSSVPVGVYATDEILKKSPISLIRAGTIGRGRYMTLFAGSTASVEEAHQEGLFQGGMAVAGDVFLPDIADALYDGVMGNVRKMGEGPLLVLETPTVAACLAATERMLKGVPVELLEIRLGDPRMDGKGLSIVQGELFDVEAARELAVASAEEKGIAVQHRILSAPTPFILRQIGASTRFDRTDTISLEGETPEG